MQLLEEDQTLLEEEPGWVGVDPEGCCLIQPTPLLDIVDCSGRLEGDAVGGR